MKIDQTKWPKNRGWDQGVPGSYEEYPQLVLLSGGNPAPAAPIVLSKIRDEARLSSIIAIPTEKYSRFRKVQNLSFTTRQ
jgi:hypothetical protein